MIDLTFNLTDGVARLARTTTIKPGGDVPVRITFDAAPAGLDSIQLALGSDGAPPSLLAFAEDFSEESETVRVGVLDANDSRLIAFMNDKSVAQVNAELTVGLDGETIIAPNVAVTVQQRILNGPGATDGGPVYYTQAQIDAVLATFASAAEQADINVAAAASAPLFIATAFGSLAARINAAAGGGGYTAVYSLPVAAQTHGAIVELTIELDASVNPNIEIRNATAGGTLLATITNSEPEAAASWHGRFRFNGTAWQCLFRAFNS